MSWLQIRLTASEQQAAHVSNVLNSAGAVAVTLQDAAHEPRYEPAPGETPLWKTTCVTGLFAAETDVDEVLSRIRAACDPAVADSGQIETLQEQDWERQWMDRFQPIRFGDRLWICPSWCAPPDPAAVNVVLDPGLAFGTGTHPTTALCLEWLDGADLRDALVIDYGCGSGILSLAAAKLGAAHVYAVDHDPQALQATQENARRNQIEDCLTTLLPDQLPGVPRDILLANILAGPLKALAREFAGLVKPGGHLILSGILADQASDVQHAYASWIDLRQITERDGWVRLAGVRDAAHQAAGATGLAEPQKTRRDRPIDLDAIAAESRKAEAAGMSLPPATEAPPHTAAWSIAILLSLALFAGQYGYFYRNDLAGIEAVRPWLERLCTTLGCDIPLRSDPTKIRIIGREVISHPVIPGALMVNATLVNDADFRQRFPLLQLGLTDLDGDVLALRRFRPPEYLDVTVDLQQGMAPDLPVQALLEIADPGTDVVGFRFDFF